LGYDIVIFFFLLFLSLGDISGRKIEPRELAEIAALMYTRYSSLRHVVPRGREGEGGSFMYQLCVAPSFFSSRSV
jgi:hypothetical protein